MGKIICEVCGTSYLDTSDVCPICGYAQSEFAVEAQEDFLADSPMNNRGTDINENFGEEEEIYSDSQPVISDYDDEDFDDYEEEVKSKRSLAPSTIVIILLVVIITLLLLAIGILFFGFYLPNQSENAAEAEPVVKEAIVEEVTEESTEPTIPCTSLVLTSGLTELTREGQYWLLHVTVLPEDTTDTLIFVSEDESVVTVNEHGRLTAVGEGETTVSISCGEKQINCKVVVAFQEEETTPSEEEQGITANSVEHETLPEGLEKESETKENEVQDSDQKETTEPVQETTEPVQETTESGEIVLKLEKKDVSSTKKGISFELKLACDLKPEDVTWFTMDSEVAIVKNGVVTTIGPGQTRIIAQYQDQQVECIVRCNF